MVEQLRCAIVKSGAFKSDLIGRILKSDQSGRSFAASSRLHLRGVRKLTVLSEMQVGEAGILESLELPENVRNHLMHMGFVPETRVVVLRRAPAGDPTVYAVDGLEIALRRETASHIRVRNAPEQTVQDELMRESSSRK